MIHGSAVAQQREPQILETLPPQHVCMREVISCTVEPATPCRRGPVQRTRNVSPTRAHTGYVLNCRAMGVQRTAANVRVRNEELFHGLPGEASTNKTREAQGHRHLLPPPHIFATDATVHGGVQ